MKVRPAKEFGEFARPLRSIRVVVDDETVRLELLDSVGFQVESIATANLTTMTEIVEGDCLLVLAFERVFSVKIHDEGCDPDLTSFDDQEARLQNGAIWPVCEVLSDEWRQSLPDFSSAQLSQPPPRHWKVFSMAINVEVLAHAPVATPNPFNPPASSGSST